MANLIYIGNNVVTALSLGSTTITEVWIGNTKIYPETIIVTYTLTDVTMNLSSGSNLLPNISNYAYITATLNEYHNGTLYQQTSNLRCVPTISSVSSPLEDFFTIDSNNAIWFNYADYKGVDLYTTYGSTYTTSWTASYNGVTSSTTVYLATTSNKKTSSTNSQFTLAAVPSTMTYTGGNTAITPTLNIVTTNSYTSGYTDSTTSHVGGIVISYNGTAIGTTTHDVAVNYTIPTNTGSTSLTYTFSGDVTSGYAAGITNFTSVTQSPYISTGYYVDEDLCYGCGSCVDGQCPTDAISFNDETMKAYIDPDLCIGCGHCSDTCPVGAIKER